MGGTCARMLSNFAAFIHTVSSNNREIMPPRSENFNVSREALKAATDATYHQQPLQCDCIIRKETQRFDVYIREVLVSVTNVIPFTRRSRCELTPQKT